MRRRWMTCGVATDAELRLTSQAFDSQDEAAWSKADNLLQAIESRSIGKRMKAYRELDDHLIKEKTNEKHSNDHGGLAADHGSDARINLA